MRKVVFYAAAAVIVSAGSVFAQGTSPKIAFINSQAIMSSAPGRAEAEALFDKESASANAQMQRMEDSLRTMIDAYDKDAAKLDSATRVTRGKAIQTRQGEYQKRAQDMQQQLEQRRDDLIRPIMEQVNKILEDMRAENGYAMIFDVTSQGNAIVAADKNLDITEKVIARLKAAKPAAATSTTTPAGVTRPKQ